MWIAIAVAIASLIALACIKLKYPINLVLMYVFVVTFSVMIAAIVARYFENGYGVIVLQAFAVTAAVFLTITAYCYVTKKDFSFLYGFLGAAFMVLICLVVVNFALGWVGGRSRWFTFVISLVGYVYPRAISSYCPQVANY